MAPSASDLPRRSADPAATSLHLWTSDPRGASRNLFALDGATGLVVVDAPFRRSDGAAARAWLATLGRPVAAVLLTHAHPDHVLGLREMLGGREVPILATAALEAALRAEIPAMLSVVAGLIGPDETESDPLLPNLVVPADEAFLVDGLPFTVTDLGEAESSADCVWRTPSLPGAIFSGDLVMHRTHLSFFQGRSARYIAAVERLAREAPPGALFMAGHGGLAPAAAVPRQLAYMRAFREAVREIARGRTSLDDAGQARLRERMLEVEPSTLLSFLIAGGGQAVARELAAEA